MDSYFIFYVNEDISLYICSKNELKIKSFEGEESQKYDKQKFWEWFKEKVEYEKEPLSFVVISDKKEFNIPDDIKIAEKNSFLSSPSCLSKIKQLQSGYNIISIPNIEDLDKNIPKQIKKIKPIKPKIENISKPTIADIYKKETQRYKNDKR